MPRSDPHMLLGLALMTTALLVLQALAGLNADVLLAAPVLLLFLPLLVGRYVGEDRLVRLAARSPAPRPRATSSALPPLRAPRVVARGGRLIAVALAERGPPAPALTR